MTDQTTYLFFVQAVEDLYLSTGFVKTDDLMSYSSSKLELLRIMPISISKSDCLQLVEFVLIVCGMPMDYVN